jgi:hypothetical protein
MNNLVKNFWRALGFTTCVMFGVAVFVSLVICVILGALWVEEVTGLPYLGIATLVGGLMLLVTIQTTAIVVWWHLVDTTNDAGTPAATEMIGGLDHWNADHYGNKYATLEPLYTPIDNAWRKVAHEEVEPPPS